MSARFQLSPPYITFHDIIAGSHATLFGPHGQKLPFRGDLSLFNDRESKYAWVFEGTADPGERIVFATSDRTVHAMIGPDGAFIVRTHITVVRGEGGKPLHLIPMSTASVFRSVALAPSAAPSSRPFAQPKEKSPPTATARRL